VKELKLTKIKLSIILIVLFSLKVIGQNSAVKNMDIMETIISSGTNATGSSGTVSYSVGQVFYTYIGSQSVYNVAQGIQHQETIKNIDLVENIVAKAEAFVFPNPTTDFVNISIKGMDLKAGQQSYQLYDLQGRLIKQDKINDVQSQVNLNHLSPSIYILSINANSKVLNTFKIIKQ
jgi:hypothetical protein